MGVVEVKVAPHVSTHAQKRVLARLRTACGEMTEAADAGATGNMTKAKQFARVALARVRSAARLAG